VESDGVLGLVEEHTVIADAKAKEPLKLAGEWRPPASVALAVA